MESTDFGTVSILCIIFTAKWASTQAHAFNKHGMLSWDGMYCNISSEKSLECKWCSLDLVYSSLNIPMFSNGPTYNQYVMDTENKNMTEYHLESLLPSKKTWDDILELGLELMFLNQRQNQIIYIYWKHATQCCKASPHIAALVTHWLIRFRIYFWMFIKMIICTDWGVFSTFYSKTKSLSQDTILMTHNGMVLLAEQSPLVWVWMVLRKHT